MRRWLHYPLLVLTGLLLGLGAYLVEVAVTQRNTEGRCWTAVLEGHGWTTATPEAKELRALWVGREENAFALRFLFNTSEEVVAAYMQYVNCVESDTY